MPSKWCSASQSASTPSSSARRASRSVSSITSPSRWGSRLSGNRKSLNFKTSSVDVADAIRAEQGADGFGAVEASRDLLLKRSLGPTNRRKPIEHGVELRPRDHHNAIEVAHHDIAGFHADAPRNHWKPDAARSRLHAGIGRDAAGEHRQAHADDARAVP